jgi:hypothetical protein
MAASCLKLNHLKDNILTLLAALMEQGGGKRKEEIKGMSVTFQWIFNLY